MSDILQIVVKMLPEFPIAAALLCIWWRQNQMIENVVNHCIEAHNLSHENSDKTDSQ